MSLTFSEEKLNSTAGGGGLTRNNSSFNLLSNAFHSRRNLSSGSSDEEQHSPADSLITPLVRRRKSSYLFLKSASTRKPSNVPRTQDMLRVMETIVSFKKPMIQACMQLEGDVGIKVRFVDAVLQFVQEEDVGVKEKMAQSIFALFVDGELFRISTFSPELTKHLRRKKMDWLEEAKWEIVLELSKNETVLRVVSSCLGEKESSV